MARLDLINLVARGRRHFDRDFVYSRDRFDPPVMSVQGTGERHSDDEDDGPPPLITDSEDEECVVSKIQEDPDAAATPCSDVIEVMQG